MIRTVDYEEDISAVLKANLPWQNLKEKTILIAGASGMIGTILIDVLMNNNKETQCNTTVIAIGRELNKLEERFDIYINNPYFKICQHDINIPFAEKINADYIIQAASNTHPMAYSLDPVGTITTNVIGTYNLLELAREVNCKRFLFLSSVEIYGENRGDKNEFDESYCGYIDCNTLRAGYGESKRTAETLCNAYAQKYGIDFVIGRLSRIYGPTMLLSDTKAISQFISNGVYGENIVLKSKGEQTFTYCYAVDAAEGLLFTLFNGESGEAYNIADIESTISLKDLAEIISQLSGTQVIFDLPNEIEKKGFSKVMVAKMSAEKLNKLDWKSKTNLKEGLKKTLDMIKLNI